MLICIVLSACVAQKENTLTNGAPPEEGKKPIFIGQTNIASSINPTDSGVPWSLTSHGISENLYSLNEKGELVTRIIDELEQLDQNNWRATLKKDVLFSDGSTVNAEAVVESMNKILEENSFSNSTAGKMKFTKEGEFSFSISTERPTKLMKSVLAEWTYILFKETEEGKYVFSGPYMVDTFNAGVELKLSPNPYYPNADKRSDVVIKVFKDTSVMKLAFESGDIDMAFTVTPEVAEMLEGQGSLVNRIDAGYQYFAIINLENKPLDDINVRSALNGALNRNDMVKALHGGHAATGAFAQYYSFSGNISIESNLEDAQNQLIEAGWSHNSEGLLEKNGEVLKLRLVTYASRPDLTVLMQIAASQLKELGVETTTEIVDNIDTTAQKGEYDIIFYAQHTAPTGNPSFFLNQFFRPDGGKNFNHYKSDELVKILDEMGNVESGPELDSLAIKAQSVINNDLPVLYLVDPQWHVAVSDKLKDYRPYGGDYYIVNDQLGL